MLASFAWGFAAAATLIVGGAFALRFPVGEHALGMVMAFGAGVLICAVAYELVSEAFDTAGGAGAVALGLSRSAVFFVGDTLIDRVGGGNRKSSGGGQAAGSRAGDRPRNRAGRDSESIVLGLTILQGGVVSAAMLAAVFLSNLPEAVAADQRPDPCGWASAGSCSGCPLRW